jgi:hypothetical protein
VSNTIWENSSTTEIPRPPKNELVFGNDILEVESRFWQRQHAQLKVEVPQAHDPFGQFFYGGGGVSCSFIYEIDQLEEDFLQQKAAFGAKLLVKRLKDLVWKDLEKIYPGEHCASSKAKDQATLYEGEPGRTRRIILYDETLQNRLTWAKQSRSVLELRIEFEKPTDNFEALKRAATDSLNYLYDSLQVSDHDIKRG